MVLTCGHSFAGFAWAHDLLTRSGLSQLQPANRERTTAPELRARIFSALGVSQDGHSCGTQLNPGREWYVVAEEIIEANQNQADCGWADGGSLRLLDFWKSMSPATRFVLVYSAPEFAVGQMLLANRNAQEIIGESVSTWISCNAEMLRFYYRNPDRCLLVNASAILYAPVPFIGMAVDKFDLTLAHNASLLIEHTGFPLVASSLAKALIEDREDAGALYREMESAADIDAINTSVLNSEKRQAWQEYSDLLSRTNDPSKADEQLRRNELLLFQLHQVQEELELNSALSRELAETKRERDETVAKLNEAQASATHQTEISQRQTKAEELSQENEFLLLQLHQSQEEMEHYFVQSQELTRKEREQADQLTAHAALWRNSQPAEVSYDLRHEIEGENWYPAEADGRWAGPGDISSIKVLPPGTGQYELQLDVVDAMEPDILQNMEVSLNGMSIPLGKDCEAYPAVVLAQFSTEAIVEGPAWEFKFMFPRSVSPRRHGSNDSRSLAIRLRALRLRKL